MDIALRLVFELIYNVPMLRVLAITVAPAIGLLLYVRKKDQLEPEPRGLVWSLFFMGFGSAAMSFVLELIGMLALSNALREKSLIFELARWFIVVGLSEEFSKYLMVRLRTWKNRNFDCLFDGLVYAVAVSAGFALLENVIYLFGYGVGAVLLRAVVSVPAHICFAVIMGTWYSAAKNCQLMGDEKKSARFRRLAVFLPAVAHGLFDLLASHTSSGLVLALFIVYVIAMFIVSFRLMKKMSENDRYFIDPVPAAPAETVPAQPNEQEEKPV